MTDDLSKFNTMEFICLSTVHIWHICFALDVFGRPEFNAASVSENSEMGYFSITAW